MKRLFVRFVSGLLLPLLRRKLACLSVGAGSSLHVWKIRPAPGAQLRIGARSIVEGRITFERAAAEVSIGERAFVGDIVISAAQRVEIGDDVMIAWGVTIADHDSHSIAFSSRAGDVAGWLEGKKDWSGVRVAPVRIRDKAWIGMHSIILKGVEIGDGAIIGAGSVVTRSVAPWSVVAGNPARILREIPESER